SGAVRAAKELERNGAAEPAIEGTEDPTHPAAPNLLFDGVAAREERRRGRRVAVRVDRRLIGPSTQDNLDSRTSKKLRFSATLPFGSACSATQVRMGSDSPSSATVRALAMLCCASQSVQMGQGLPGMRS